nr:DapH/DapD/GlmU-related protein [uncultured Blautia sp.]
MGENVLIKRNAYFGDGSKIRIGNNSQIGINSIMDNDVVIGDDVTMGPDVIIYTSSHEYKDLGIPINQQGEKPHRQVTIGNNVWIGARCIILPGVSIGDNAIIGANTVVTKDVPKNAVFCGTEGHVVKFRA